VGQVKRNFPFWFWTSYWTRNNSKFRACTS